jgi:hypothetical protein
MGSKEGTHSDGTGIRDEIHVQLNDETVQGKSTLPQLPEKPKVTATKSAWEEFAVQLGLDPNVAAELDRDALVKWCG